MQIQYKLKFRYFFLILILAIFICNSCMNASKMNVIQKSEQLKKGMSKKEVEEKLGIADYSPTDGLYHYALENSKILVIDYRDKQDKLTNKLQSFSLIKTR